MFKNIIKNGFKNYKEIYNNDKLPDFEDARISDIDLENILIWIKANYKYYKNDLTKLWINCMENNYISDFCKYVDALLCLLPSLPYNDITVNSYMQQFIILNTTQHQKSSEYWNLIDRALYIYSLLFKKKNHIQMLLNE